MNMDYIGTYIKKKKSNNTDPSDSGFSHQDVSLEFLVLCLIWKSKLIRRHAEVRWAVKKGKIEHGDIKVEIKIMKQGRLNKMEDGKTDRGRNM